MPVSSPPAFKPAVAPVALGAAGTVLTSNGTGASTPPTFQAATGGGGTLPVRLAVVAAAGVINDYNPGAPWPVVCRLLVTPGAGGSALTGLLAGSDGQLVYLTNNAALGGDDLTLDNLNAGSAAANRFSISGDPFILPAQGSVSLVYDGTDALWRVGP
jgi:hypothetical protein